MPQTEPHTGLLRYFLGTGADIDVIHNTPNGTNINDKCGSQHTQDLRKRVVENGAAIGLAFDGDGDRLMQLMKRARK